MLPSARKDGEYTHRGDNHRASVYVLFARQPSSSVGRHALQRARGRPVGGNLMRTSLRWSKRAGAWALVGGGKRSVCAPTRTPSSSSSCRLVASFSVDYVDVVGWKRPYFSFRQTADAKHFRNRCHVLVLLNNLVNARIQMG